MNRIEIIKNIDQPEDFKQKAIKWGQSFDPVILFESNRHTQRSDQAFKEFDCLLAVGSQREISANHGNAFEKLKVFLEDQKDYYFGCFSYDLKNEIEDLDSRNPDRVGFPELFFFQAQKILIWKNDSLHFLYPEDISEEIEKDFQAILKTDLESSIGPSKNSEIKARITKQEYLERGRHILGHIQRGDIYEVNFCQEFFQHPCEIDPLLVYNSLNQRSEAPFSTFLKISSRYLLGASPERFIKKKGATVIAQPIKGTAKRHRDPVRDLEIATELSADQKERAENIMIVDLIRNDLSKIATKGSVEVVELCKTYSFKQVHQLISTVTCTADPEIHPVDIIKNLFPMGSMTGAPKISAMRIIEEEEVSKRGLYSGSLGYFSPEMDFDFNVVIRSILYDQKNKYASMMVGSAITAQSDINKEYEECLLKARALKEALTGKV